MRRGQVLTACLKSFAHGSNDTANAAGPFAAIQALYLHGLDSCSTISTPPWVLAFCGVGIIAVRVAQVHTAHATMLLTMRSKAERNERPAQVGIVYG